MLLCFLNKMFIIFCQRLRTTKLFLNEFGSDLNDLLDKYMLKGIGILINDKEKFISSGDANR